MMMSHRPLVPVVFQLAVVADATILKIMMFVSLVEEKFVYLKYKQNHSSIKKIIQQ